MEAFVPEETVNTKDLKLFLEDGNFQSLIDKYLYLNSEKEGSAEVRYGLYAKRLSAQRFVLPVAGVQGSGKSTFLNALAFDEPVLPVDADETTCVPVEIRWGSTDEGQVIFQDGHKEALAQCEEELKLFVHNENNPGNEKRVDRIILFSRRLFFEKGIVLVDLPGTGSLTAENIETTRRYLDEAIGVVFMLRTVPPLTQSESVFVALQWARLPSAFFVQNRWNDESAAEAEAGKEHNINVLTDLARRNHIPLEGEPEIHVVNAYRAYQGILCNDDSLFKASGIEDFVKKLNEIGVDWPEILNEGIFNALKRDIDETLDEIDLNIQRLTATKEDLESDLEREKKRFEAYIETIEDKSANTINEIEAEVTQISYWLTRWANDSRSNLRNNMRTKLRMGIVDGPRLERALRDEESQVADEAFAYVQEEILALSDLIQERFQDVEEWRIEKMAKFETVSRKEKLKYENVAPHIMGAGGGLGGVIAGAKVCGYIGGAVGGPVGIAIGAAVGSLLGGLLGTWTGDKARKVRLKRRADKIESEVFAAVTRFVENLKSDLQRQIKQFQEQVNSFLLSWKQEQVNHFETERQIKIDELNMKYEERVSKMVQLNKDFEIVKSYRSKLMGDAL